MVVGDPRFYIFVFIFYIYIYILHAELNTVYANMNFILFIY